MSGGEPSSIKRFSLCAAVNRLIRTLQYAIFLQYPPPVGSAGRTNAKKGGPVTAYQALYRKYRPRTFSDVVGQEHITETLKNELIAGKTVHAYLFTGTRGTGKTSCAKILAAAVNCLDPQNGDPCGKCESCVRIAEGENTDIVEIDAASNNSVDSVRELRDQVNFAPSHSKYRVYIIDEVHMLTASAFNALLKTLEEPPAHVVFILATTEVHKLPATILSRCQRFDFHRIEPEKICGRLRHIAEKEGFTVTDGAASLIAAAADGGMRDALSILDLCASHTKNIDEEIVENVCGMAGSEYLFSLADALKAHNTETALTLIDRLHSDSVDMQRLLSELIGHYRDLMIVKTVKNAPPVVCSASKLERLKNQCADYGVKDIMHTLSLLQTSAAAMQSGNRRCEMEMAAMKICNPVLSADAASLERRISALENKLNSLGNLPAGVSETENSTAEDTPVHSTAAPAGIIAADSARSGKTADAEDIPLPEAPDEPPGDPAELYSDAEPSPTAPGESDAQSCEQPPDAAGLPSSAPQSNGTAAADKPAENKTEVSARPAQAPGTAETKVSDADWLEIIRLLKSACPLIAGVLQDSSGYIKGGYLLIDAPNSQFRSLINSGNTQYRDSIRRAAHTVLGQVYKLGPYTKPEKCEGEDPLAAIARRLKNFELN